MGTEIEPVEKVRPYGFIFQWPELWRKVNWINFDVVTIQFEYGTYKGRYLEGKFVLLGVGFWFEWVGRSSRSVWLAGVDQIVEGVKSGDMKTYCMMCGAESKHANDLFRDSDTPAAPGRIGGE